MTWHVYRLDGSLAPAEELGRVRSIQIDRSSTEAAPLLESCSVTFDADALPWEGGWHRIEHHADGTRTSFGVFFLEQQSASIDGGVVRISADGRSVLMDAADASVPIGAYSSAGVDVPSTVSALLASCGIGCTTYGTAQLKRTVVYDDGSSVLAACWQLLDSVCWRIRLDGSGGVHVEPLPSAPAFRVTNADPHGVMPGIETGEEPSYKRAMWSDDARPLDIVAVVMPQYGIDASKRVTSQSISAGIVPTCSEKLGERSVQWD